MLLVFRLTTLFVNRNVSAFVVQSGSIGFDMTCGVVVFYRSQGARSLSLAQPLRGETVHLLAD